MAESKEEAVEHSPVPSPEKPSSPKGDIEAAGTPSVDIGKEVIKSTVPPAPTAGVPSHVSYPIKFLLSFRPSVLGKPHVF